MRQGFSSPPLSHAESRSAVLDLATQAIVALGVHTGCLHTEVKFTPDGPRIIEVNGRVGGGVPEMLERAAGVSLLDLTLRVALDEPVFVDGPVATDRIGYRFFLQPPTVSATVTAIEGINDFTDHAEVDTVSVHQGPGATLDLAGRLRQPHRGRGRLDRRRTAVAGGLPAPPPRGHRDLQRCEALRWAFDWPGPSMRG